jgi:phage baseplate assembly protein W
MTKSMRVPFRIEGGKVADTRDRSQIVEQKIIDVLVTGIMERVPMPLYGVGIQQFLFESLDELVEVDFKTDAVSAIQSHVSGVSVADIRIRIIDETQADITVYYRTPLSDIQAASFLLAVPSLLNEESPI